MEAIIRKSRFIGLELECKDYPEFDILKLKTSSGHTEAYDFFIRFKETGEYGLCTYSARRYTFVKKPGTLQAYKKTLQEVVELFGLDFDKINTSNL